MNNPHIIKRDTVKMYTFEFWYPYFSAQEHRIFKIIVSNPPYLGGRHHFFEDQLLQIQDMRTPKSKSFFISDKMFSIILLNI